MSMVDSDIRRVIVPDAALEVEVRGSGEPVVLIRTALIADEFEPIASTLRRRADHTIVLYHRRGYAGSSPVHGPGSIPQDAIDCRRLLAELGIECAGGRAAISSRRLRACSVRPRLLVRGQAWISASARSAQP